MHPQSQVVAADQSDITQVVGNIERMQEEYREALKNVNAIRRILDFKHLTSFLGPHDYENRDAALLLLEGLSNGNGKSAGTVASPFLPIIKSSILADRPSFLDGGNHKVSVSVLSEAALARNTELSSREVVRRNKAMEIRKKLKQQR